MKLTEFSLQIDDTNNIVIIGPDNFEKYLTNFNLAYLLMTIKNNLSIEDWNNLIEQIKDIH
jgi:hypothetical protein